MKRLFVTAFVVSLAFLLPTAKHCQAGDLHVSPGGKDSNPGTKDQPLKTLAAAQKAARIARKQGAVTIHLLPGTYYLESPLVLTADDSGTREAPIVWKGEEGKVIVSGAKKLSLRFQESRDSILAAKVFEPLQADQLFVNNQLQILARYPNFDPSVNIYNGHSADCLSPRRVARWQNPAGGFFHAMHEGQWGGFSYRITGKTDDNQVRYQGGWQGNRPSNPHAQLRFVENILEELDVPGEWFFDRKGDMLYFYPPAGMDVSRATIEIPQMKHLVEMRGNQQSPVRSVSFEGITFRHTLRTFMDTKEPLLRSDWTIYRGGALFLNGTEDCSIRDCYLENLGGNGIFVNNFNRRLTVSGCRIEGAGANGVIFVGDQAAVRNGLNNYDQTNRIADIDRKPGPKTDNYPADCLVKDCLITRIGRIEKQSAGVSIHMSARITIDHCSIYDVPRAGINIGDGCWGGDIIENCDIFDTVKETGDHGSFNSWGRDRFWNLQGVDLNRIMLGNEKDLPYLDTVEPIILRNNRWRCDHGWDIDLDDGSSNYRIYNNLCLKGGLKNREGFDRIVENNIMVGNSFHPHVWYQNSSSIFRKNIVFTPYQPIGVPEPWGKEVDYNLLHAPGNSNNVPAKELRDASKRDEHSLKADAHFINPSIGDYRVRDNSPALKLGFQNFPMDQFGVVKPSLRAIARTPLGASTGGDKGKRSDTIQGWNGGKVKNIVGQGEMSVYGTPGETGVRLINVPDNSPLALAGLKADDVIVGINGDAVADFAQLEKLSKANPGKKVKVRLLRKQKELFLDLQADQ